MFVRLSSGPQQRLQKISFGLSSNNKTGTNRKRQNAPLCPCSLSLVITFSVALALLGYMLMVVSFTRSMSLEESGTASQRSKIPDKKKPDFVPRDYAGDESGDRKTTTQKNDWIKSKFVRKKTDEVIHDEVEALESSPEQDSRDGMESLSDPGDRILTAYLEPIDRSTWKKKPLPPRTSTAEDLKEVRFRRLNSCQRLLEQWPVDDYPTSDPFLPWIHDVFPTHDGKFIQFIAQNRRRYNY